MTQTQAKTSDATNEEPDLSTVAELTNTSHEADFTDLIIEYLPPRTLTPCERNARTHSKKQVRQLSDSIKCFGFTNPVIIDDQSMIMAGHCRVQAALLLSLEQVPCVRLSSMSDAQKRAYMLADNKIAINAGWDEALLAEELRFLVDETPIDIDMVGFTIAEVDCIIATDAPVEDGDPDDDKLPGSDTVAKRCNRGDIWQLGNHRLVCGDARSNAHIDALMAGEAAQMVFADPPYNVPINGHVSGLGKVKHREFALGSGEMSSDDFTAFLNTSLTVLHDHSVDGSIHFICMDWRHASELLAAGLDVYAEMKNLIVWVKDNGGMGTFYRSRHELIFAFKKGAVPHINTFELGQHGRYRTNVWQYRGVNTLKAGRDEELAMHPTVKPVQMIADAIKDVSARGGIVLDTFGGAGSTLIAAHKTGRRGYVCELDPEYCDVIIARYEAFANDEATKIGTVGDCSFNASEVKLRND